MDNDAAMLALAQRARNGDKQALNQLIGWLEPLVVRAVRLIVGSGSGVAEEAAQEAMVDITRSIGSLREPAAVRVWAGRIATRRAIKIARREQLRSLARLSRTAAEPNADVQQPSLATLKEVFDELPPRLRATAVLRLYLGFSEAETAEVLESTVGTVKSNLHDARHRLAETLRKRGVAPMIMNATEEARR